MNVEGKKKKTSYFNGDEKHFPMVVKRPKAAPTTESSGSELGLEFRV